MLYFPQAKLDVVQTRALTVGNDIFTRFSQHLRGHIHSDGPALRSHLASRDKDIETAARSQIQYDLARH
jgi:hypothetical protein